MFLYSLSSISKRRYYFFVVVAALIIGVHTSCNHTTTGGFIEETYEDPNDCYSDYNNRWICRERTIQKWVDYHIFFCDNSSLEEAYLNNIDQHGNISFIIKDSYINSLVADGKKWSGLTKLTLDTTNISTIIPGFFNGFTDLNVLIITNNNIHDIVDGVFSTLTHLQGLNLSNNSISSLGRHAFLGLSTLKTLDLSENQISVLPTQVLTPLNSLDYLDLSNNNITQINEVLKLNGLETIYLKQIRLLEFDFYNITPHSYNWKILDISRNNISKLKNLETFQADHVNVAFNILQSLEKIGKIVSFNASHNHLVQLLPDFVSSSVNILDLSFNMISSISLQTFASSNNLKNLNLSHNDLKTLPNALFQHLKSLEYLDLSYNNIKRLDFGTFNDVENLKHLSISHNKGILDLHIFLRSPFLESLDIEENEVKNLDEKFLELHPSFKNISMSGSTWSCLDLANTLHFMQLRNITVTRGHTEHSSNLLGIACNGSSDDTFQEQKYNSILSENNTSTNIIFLRYFKEMMVKLEKMFNNSENYNKNMADKLETIFNKTENFSEKRAHELEEISFNKSEKYSKEILDRLEQIFNKTGKKSREVTVKFEESDSNNTVKYFKEIIDNLEKLFNKTNRYSPVMSSNFQYSNNTDIYLKKMVDKLEHILNKTTGTAAKVEHTFSNNSEKYMTEIADRLEDIINKTEKYYTMMTNNTEYMEINREMLQNKNINISFSPSEPLSKPTVINNNSSVLTGVSNIFIIILLSLICCCLLFIILRLKKQSSSPNEQVELIG